MTKKIVYLLNVYKRVFQINFARYASFRIHFTLTLLLDVIFYFYSILIVKFIYTHVQQIGIWDYPTFLFFTTFSLLIYVIHTTIFSHNAWMLSERIRLGNLDFDLTKPFSTLFIIFFSEIRIPSIPTFFLALSGVIWTASQLNFSLLDWLLLPFFALISTVLMMSLEILICFSMFWTIQGRGINFFRMQLQSISRWPDFIYQSMARKFFIVVIPLLLISSAPVHFLINKNGLLLLGMFIAIFGVWTLIYFVWPIALKKYESASS